jgi:hypothetical protein
MSAALAERSETGAGSHQPIVSYPTTAVRGPSVVAVAARTGTRRRRPMTQYLITFTDEWVPDHTGEELGEKARAARVVLEEMLAEDVLIFTNGGLDRSTAVFSVESVDGKPVFTDGPYVETKEHLGGFAVVDVPDDEAARYWAGRLATALDWPQEVHRFRGSGQARRIGSEQN